MNSVAATYPESLEQHPSCETPSSSAKATALTNEERRLIGRLRTGDEGAFDELVNRHHGALVRMAMGHVADREVAEEVAQDTWMAVIEGLHRFEGRSSLRTWIFGILIHKAKDRGVRVSYDFDERANFVLADRVPVQQVVINLVLNAIDAMADQPRRELKVATSLGEDGFAVVSVSDTGAGIDPAAADRLFQPFVTTTSKGMGVGLSISRTIVESHGGRIWTEPNPGGGAIFRFSLRLVSEDEAAEQAHA